MKPREEGLIHVCCYSGSRVNERPVYIIVDSRKIEVREVLDRWYGPDDDFFKFRGDDLRDYIIRWNRSEDSWYLMKVFSVAAVH